jgi:hypothetical protein
MTGDDEPSTPIPTGPFFSNRGPREGLILYGGAPVMGVLQRFSLALHTVEEPRGPASIPPQRGGPVRV